MPNSLWLIRSLFHETLLQVDVAYAVQREIKCNGSSLTIASQHYDLGKLDRIAIVAVGKAATPMLEAAVQALDSSSSKRLKLDAIVVSPVRPKTSMPNLLFYEGSHPTPNEVSRQAATEILKYLQAVDERTLVLYLISGDASSMIERPLDQHITVADTAAFYRSLVTSGLPIAKMNVLRKHFSAVKGGRLAMAAKRATAQCTLVVSDVPDHSPESARSGPSVPDASATAKALHILHSLPESSVPPERILAFFKDPSLQETPKPEDPIFKHTFAREILSSSHLTEAATSAGFHVEVDNTCDDWDFRRQELIYWNAPPGSLRIILAPA